MEVTAVLHIPTLHGKIFEGIFPMWKFAKLLPSQTIKSNLTFKIYCPNFGGNYNPLAELCIDFGINTSWFYNVKYGK